MRQRFWLLLPAWCLCAADVALTLVGQTTAYWEGDYSQAIEHNPIARPFLVVHPWLFVGFALAWAVMFSLLILYWTHAGSGWLAILIALSHAIGGSSWLTGYGRFGWVLAIAYLAGAAWLSGISWRRAGLGHSNPRDTAESYHEERGAVDQVRVVIADRPQGTNESCGTCDIPSLPTTVVAAASSTPRR